MNLKTGKHMLIMLACCLIPLALLGAVLFMRIDLGSFGLVAIMLLCPLLHIFMMRGMSHDHGKAGQACHEEAPTAANAAETAPRKG